MKPWRVPYPKFGAGPGLARVSELARRLGLDLAAFGATGAVIVGSNGKGSTAAMTASLLQQTTAPVGLFTSPHLLALNERFRVDGEDIGDEDLSRHWDRVASAIDAYQRESGDVAGGFEFLFLIAADWFAARGCAHTVWEAGIGGRLDPVRLIAARHVALTSLDFEHTALLGGTLDQIAREKVGAAPEGSTLFVPERIAAQGAIAAACAEQRVALRLVAAHTSAPLPGEFQRDNAGLAVALARSLAALDEGAVDAGLAATRWPGRLERIAGEPLVAIDVGHTPAAVTAALAGFEAMRGGRASVLVCGVSADKDVRAIVAALAPAFETVICAAARHKGAPAGTIAAAVSAANSTAEIIVAESVAEARRLALARAGVSGAVYVAGGLFLAAEFKAAHLGLDPSRLAFL